jgi:extracellular elastinolytic metalloproteinase
MSTAPKETLEMNARIIVSGMLSAAIVAGLGLASPQVQAQGDPATQALNFIQKNKQDFGLTGSDIGEVEVLSVIPAGDNGVAHVYLQQRYRGIEVAYGVFTVNLTADGAVLNPGHRFMDHIAAAAGSQSAKKSSVSAAEAAARHVGLQVKRPFEVVKVQGGPKRWCCPTAASPQRPYRRGWPGSRPAKMPCGCPGWSK